MLLYGTHTNVFICLLTTRVLVVLRLWTFVVAFFRTILLCFTLLGCRVRTPVAQTMNMYFSTPVRLIRNIFKKSTGVFSQNHEVSK